MEALSLTKLQIDPSQNDTTPGAVPLILAHEISRDSNSNKL